MQIYYFTFFPAHWMSGHVQPILAHSSDQARSAMIIIFGYEWGLQLTEKEWEQAKVEGANDRELDLVDARKVTLSDFR